ncbi:pyroglutamyl-peptidase 1 isoform X2 [Varanus komodoensis]|uniref:pyroglutamyl-peptidase 1 isoform X2 n=1 Tax=Varanus komodoensis TaxID=61221 RepID=UPI001CF7C072|nr:pyroglutamyl-peptidase 1 isoform X2 [Varanus komodoensis]
MEKSRRPVVVTGFGPFGEHSVNASWIAVQELEKMGLREDVDLHVYEIPVEYQAVQRLIPALWEKHSPQVPLRFHLLHVPLPEPRPVGLCARAPAGQTLQRRAAGPGAAGHHRGDAQRAGALREQHQLPQRALSPGAPRRPCCCTSPAAAEEPPPRRGPRPGEEPAPARLPRPPRCKGPSRLRRATEAPTPLGPRRSHLGSGEEVAPAG